MKNYFNIIFWVVAFLALIFVFGNKYGGYSRSFYFVSFLFPIILGTSVFYNEVLVRKYLLQKKLIIFIIYTLYTLVISVYLELLVITGSLAIIANYQYENLNPKTKDILFLTVIMFFLVFLNTITLLAREYFMQQKINIDLLAEQDKLISGHLIIKHNRRNRSINFDMIQFVEGVGNYSKVNLKDGESILTKETIGSIERRLTFSFIRVHRSIIVNRHAITSFSREKISIDDVELPISRKYKNAIEEKLIT